MYAVLLLPSSIILTLLQMPPQDSFVHFGIATVTICIPSYLFIFSLNSETWQERYLAMFDWTRAFLAHPLRRGQTGSQPSQNWWSRFWEPKSEPPMQKRRLSRSLTIYEDLASRNENVAVPVSRPDNKNRSFAQSAKIRSRESSIRFDLPSFERQSRSEKQDKDVPDPGPLSTLPEGHVVSGVAAPRRGFLKSIANKVSGQNLPKSPV
jgi:hypothetical protein